MKNWLNGMVGILLCAGAAQAQTPAPTPIPNGDRPVLLPRHDVAVTYRITSSVRGAPGQVRIAIKAGGQKLRLEPDNQPGYALVDRGAKSAHLVLPQPHLVMDVSTGDEIDRYLNDPSAQFRRLGDGSVAGHACTRWAMHSPQADGEGCITADGVILKAEGHDRKNQSGTAEAITVSDAPLADDQFAVPPGFQKLSLSNFGKSLKLSP